MPTPALTTPLAHGAGLYLPTQLHHVNAAVMNGRIYVLCALLPDFSAVGLGWSWAPGESDWTGEAQMAAGSEVGAAVVGVAGDRILVAGGFGKFGTHPERLRI